MKVDELRKLLEEKEIKISKAQRVKSLLQKHKGLVKKKQALTDFKEPVLDLHTRGGGIETYENVTAGEFIYTHSDGKARRATLRPEDQETRDYGGRKVRWYSLHEDRPYAGWDNPIVDSESVMLGYERTKATDLKYEERIQKLKNASKMTWLWVIGGIILAIAFAITIIPQSFWDRFKDTAPVVVPATPPTIGLIWAKLRE